MLVVIIIIVEVVVCQYAENEHIEEHHCVCIRKLEAATSSFNQSLESSIHDKKRKGTSRQLTHFSWVCRKSDESHFGFGSVYEGIAQLTGN